ncbi:MAG: sigma-E factor negative regulatory protein RseB [Frankiales bacterium]|nr:sigma-E factor negative regulatory protein RseB [Frankiales bacterium]
MSLRLSQEPATVPARHRLAPRRPRRALLAAACVAGGALAVPFGAGSSSAVGTVGMAALVPAPEGGADAVAMLERAYKESQLGTYHGVQLVMIDNQTHYVGVSHLPGHTYLYADSGPTEAYETNDATAAASSANPLSKDPLALLKQHYRLSIVGNEIMLGRTSTVIEAATPGGRVAAKFWVDETSSLLVRRDTFDAQGNPYSRVKYTSLVVNSADPTLQTVTSTAQQPPARVEDADRLDQLRARGWWAQPQLPGALTLYDAREVAGVSGTVLHLSYSDGISTVSVFEQRGRLAGASGGQLPSGWRSVSMPDGRRVVQADGVPVRAAWQARDLVVAVIADVPPGSVTGVIDALPYGAAPARHDMVLGRVGRGLGRIGNMLNPFG